ncbi:MAG: ATP-dependent DNA helicase RecG [Thermotogae bacterium]|nr:ATP-dependent DNA helicase RecG [Thermotogota bacterium]
MSSKITLETDVKYLKGVGPKRAKLLNKLGVRTVEDLLYLLPRRYVDRSVVRRIAMLQRGQEAVVRGRILEKFRSMASGRREAIIRISDGTGTLDLVWRNMDFILGRFKVGQVVYAAGRVYIYGGTRRMYFPEVEEEGKDITGILPIYPQTEGLSSKVLRQIIRGVLREVDIPETLPRYILRARGLPGRKEALRYLHTPKSKEEIHLGRGRIAYEELLKFYLRLNMGSKLGRRRAIPLRRTGELTDRFVESLPFTLTRDQRRAMAEIEEDMAKEEAMHRLLQGDVGSGKTVVLLYASLIAIESGYQAALMAPTEILAEQLFMVAENYLRPLGVNVVLLTSSLGSRTKRNIRGEIATGRAQLVIGTHALITEDTTFKNLALAIVDEQHRFGVAQRARLLEKGRGDTYPHFLVSTATPIPRTLALTLYGDLEVSRIRERPFKGEVINRIVWKEHRAQVYRFLFGKILETGKQAYVIAPLIEESEKLEDVVSVQRLYEELRAVAPPQIRLGLVHGRMPYEERKEEMERFRAGEIDILVATTVIEVGVDVPNAKYMVVEDANRFGIAQLHQLRGRIMRSEDTAFFIMIAPRKMSYEASMRLRAVANITDGFTLAEEDLKIRGPGELLGTRQHGELSFRGISLADISSDNRLLRIAEICRQDARHILQKDPHLRKPENRLLRTLIERTFASQDIVDVG